MDREELEFDIDAAIADKCKEGEGEIGTKRVRVKEETEENCDRKTARKEGKAQRNEKVKEENNEEQRSEEKKDEIVGGEEEKENKQASNTEGKVKEEANQPDEKKGRKV